MATDISGGFSRSATLVLTLPSAPVRRVPLRGGGGGALSSFTTPSQSSSVDLVQSAGGGAGVQEVAEGVADEVQGQDDDEDREAREQDDVRAQDDELSAGREHAAPVGGRRLSAEAEEGETGRGADLGAHVEAEGHDHRR